MSRRRHAIGRQMTVTVIATLNDAGYVKSESATLAETLAGVVVYVAGSSSGEGRTVCYCLVGYWFVIAG